MQTGMYCYAPLDLRFRWEDKEAVTVENGWLVLRNVSAFLHRLEEPPPRLVRKWRESEARYGVVTIDDLLEIAELPKWQYDTVMPTGGSSGILESTGGMAMWGDPKTVFQFIAGLEPKRRKAFLAGERIPLSAMTSQEQAAYHLARKQATHAFTEPPDNAEFYAAFIKGGPYRVTLSDPATGKTWTEEPNFSSSAHDMREALANVRESYEFDGYVVSEVKVSPAPREYEVIFGWKTEDSEDSSRYEISLRPIKEEDAPEQ